MPTTFIIDEESTLYKNNMLENTNNRLIQYQNGIEKLIELNSKYNFDIYIADNGLDVGDKININNKIKTNNNNPNKYGKYNKGSGLIEIWNNNIEIIKQYDYIIHFEPRQLLIDNYFIDNFMKNPRTLFTYNHNSYPQKHFNTGLFTCKTMELLKFIENYSPQFLIEKNLGIEYALYFFYTTNNIKYDVLDKMSLIWYPSNTNLKYYW